MIDNKTGDGSVTRQGTRQGTVLWNKTGDGSVSHYFAFNMYLKSGVMKQLPLFANGK